MADHDEQLGKKDFADKCVPYKSLLREIDAQEKTSYLKRELSLYILFMVVFVHWVVSFSNVNNAFYLDRVVYSTLIDKRFPETNEPTNVNFLTFHEIDTRETYFQWLREVMAKDLFLPAAESLEGSSGEVLDWNRLLWGFRFRQARVAAGAGCEVPAPIKEAGIVQGQCATFYTQSTRDVEPFGPANLVNRTTADGSTVEVKEHAFTWQDQDVLGASTVDGHLGTYDGSGYVVDLLLNSTAEDMSKTFQTMQDHFVDDRTRAVFLTFTLYNVNYNLFMWCNFITEFGPTGIVVPSQVCRAAPLLPGANSSPGGLATLSNAILCILILVYLYRLVVKELRYLRRIEPFWMLIDIVSIVLLMYHLLFVIRAQLFGEGQLELTIALGQPEFYSTDSFTKWYYDLYGYYAVNMVLICIRIFKFLKLSSGLSMVWKTMSRAVRDLLYFTGLFVIIFIGFALCGYLVFGPHLRDYATVTFSASTLLRMVVGEVQYAPLRRINPEFAWVFFGAYVVLFFFVLLNIFLAIILDAWQAEADAERRSASGVDLVEEFKADLVKWWESFRKNYSRPRYWRGLFRGVRDKLLNRNKRRDFLSDEVVLTKLQEWKRKRANRAKKFLSITDLQQALEGVPKEQEVREAQLVDVFVRSKRHLIPLETAASAEGEEEEAGGDDEDTTQDMGISELKKLQASFSLLAENQRRHMDTISEKIDGLSNIQNQTTDKVDYMDEQVKKIVPHFAE